MAKSAITLSSIGYSCVLFFLLTFQAALGCEKNATHCPMPRYFPNPFLSDWESGAAQVTTQLLKAEASTLYEMIARDMTRQNQDMDAYTGLSGSFYGLLKALELLPERRNETFAYYSKYLEPALKRTVQLDLKGHHARDESQFLLGQLGAYVIAALAENVNGTLSETFVNRVKDTREVMLRDKFNKDYGDDEMLVGRAGYVAAVLNLRMQLGERFDYSFVKPVLDKMIESGRNYSVQHRSPTPLMYQYHGKEYMGAAHGLMGILQMLLSFYELLDDSQKSDVVRTVDWVITTQHSNGNFPSSTHHLHEDRGDDELVQWCHGAAGAVPLFIVAFLKLHNTKYLEVVKKALNVIWEKGVLFKGPGVCHGVAGNGYAFLMFYRLTKEKKYLDCAKCFAQICCSDWFRKKARTPDSPLSLYEGISGTLCFLTDLAHPEKAQFPLVPLPF